MQQPVRRWTEPVYGEYDRTTGRLVKASHRGPPEPQILHDCGAWTWERANFCTSCGKPLESL